MIRISKILLSFFFCCLIFSTSVLYAEHPPMTAKVPFVIDSLNIVNSQQSDMAGAIINDSLYFSSLRNASFDKKNKKQGSSFYELYNVKVNQNGFSTSDIVKNVKDGVFGHDVINSFCAKTGEIFVSRSNIDDPEIKRLVFKKKEVRIRIVILKTENGVLKTEEFPYNNSLYNVAHPAISSSGDTLYFSSNKDGGSMDLYYSVRMNGMWGIPVKLDGTINTEGNELFPFVDRQGTLYFASDGLKGGKGGLDIWFATKKTDNGFNNPILFENGVNSKADDFGFFLKEDSDYGYFTSNRNGGKGDDDIYIVSFPYIRGKVIDFYTRQPIDSASVSTKNLNILTNKEGKFSLFMPALRDFELTASKKTYESQTKTVPAPGEVLFELKGRYFLHLVALNKKSGKKVNVQLSCDTLKNELRKKNLGTYECELDYNSDYVFIAKSTKYFTERKAISTKGKPYGTINDTIFLSNSLTLNILYDYNKTNIREDAAAELDILVKYLNESPELFVEIGAHTDCRGTEEYNMKLSEDRAKSAVEYIISKGIAADRISFKGYGETKPIIDCVNEKCTEEMYQVNRRTEITILDK